MGWFKQCLDNAQMSEKSDNLLKKEITSWVIPNTNYINLTPILSFIVTKEMIRQVTSNLVNI